MGRLSQRIAAVAVAMAGMAVAQVVGGGAQAGRGQAGPGVRAGQAAGEMGGGARGRGPVMPGRRGGAWIPWGWGWGGTNVIVQEKEVEKEPAFRPWVENKEYVRESLKPEVREYPEGTLAAPKMERVSRESPCELVLTDGTMASSERCERRADTVTYIDGSERKVWLSADLVDWEKSRFALQR